MRARHPARRRAAARALDPRHLHHRPGRDALADRDRRGRLFPGPQRARRRRDRRRRRPARARRRCASRCGRTGRRGARRARARPARPALPQPRQGAGALRRALRRLRRGRRPRPGPASALAPVGGPGARRPRRRRGADAAHPRRLRGLPAAARILHHAGAVPLRPGRRPARRWSRGRPSELEIVFLLRRPAPELADLRPQRPAALRHAGDQPLRARLQRRRDRPAPAAAGAARRPHPPARLRDLPGDRASRTPTARGRRRGSPALFGFAQNAGGRPGLVGRAPPAPPRRGRAAAGPDAHLLRRRRRLPVALLARAAPRPARDARGWRRARSAPTATCRSSTTSRR